MDPKQLNIASFVTNVTWKELLLEMLDTKQLDPWDIDISAMVDGYISVVRQMKILDLRVPANIILAASILLRMKSDGFSVFEEPVEEMPIDQNGLEQRIPPEIPNLIQKNRLQPHRKITLTELMDALGAAIKQEEKKMYIKELDAPIQISVSQDIDARIENLYTKINRHIDHLKMTTFNILSTEYQTTESKLLDLFIPLLFLAQSAKVNIIQEEFFGELIIKLNDLNDGENRSG